MKATTSFTGSLKTKVHRSKINIKVWRFRNQLRLDYMWNWFIYHLAGLFSKKTGIVTMRGRLWATVIRKSGLQYNLGLVSRGLVTTVFCEDMVDELIAETTTWGDYKFHDSGEGVTPAAIGDSDIETTDGESRATGTQVENTSVGYRSIGTIPYTSTKAITEHAIFNDVSAGTLMDHHIFGAINVEDGDSIQFTYDLTCTAGG